MFIRKFGQEYHQIAVTDSYQEVHDNYDKFDDHTGLHSAFAMEDFEEARTKMGSNYGTLIIEKSVPITADVSVGANIDIDIRKGGSFAVATGVTLSLAGRVQTNGQSFGDVFGGLGTVDFSAPAIHTKIETGGGMVAGGSEQTIYEESVTQNFVIGTRRVIDDRVFRYCRAGTALRELIPGVCGMSQIEGNTIAVEALAGQYNVSILDIARVADWYKGGYYWAMEYAPAVTGIGHLYRIKSSAEGIGVFVELTLEEPIVRTIPASNWSTTWANIYGNVQCGVGLTQCSMVCMPLIVVQNAYYFWGQTWGPTFFQCGYTPGVIANDREFYYMPQLEGVEPGSEVDFATDIIPQRVGFLLPNTQVVGTDNFAMLQLSP